MALSMCCAFERVIVPDAAVDFLVEARIKGDAVIEQPRCGGC